VSAATSTQQSMVTVTVLKALVKHFGSSDQVLSYLPAAAAEKVRSCSLPEHFVMQDIVDPRKWLEIIHSSWFLPYLTQLPSPLLRSYLALFPVTVAKSLAQTLGCQEPLPSLSVFAQCVLISHLKSAMQLPATILPFGLLPSSPFTSLFSISEQQLLALIDHLGIYDLAAETKQIVDKQILEKIQHALTSAEQKFLVYCTKQAIMWVPPRLNLKGWDGQKETFRALIQARGLVRLGKATLTENMHFRWYLVHHLDTNRGKALTQHYKQTLDRTLLSYFQKQVLELLERIPA